LYQRETVQWHGYLVVWLTTAFAWACLAHSSGGWQTASPSRQKAGGVSGGLHLESSFAFAVIEAVLFAGITPRFGLP
jgi:hypothetical protein